MLQVSVMPKARDQTTKLKTPNPAEWSTVQLWVELERGVKTFPTTQPYQGFHENTNMTVY